MRKPSLLYASLLAATVMLSGVVSAQRDSARTNNFPNAGQRPSGPRPYKEVITDKAITRRGMFTIHKVDDRYYFELPMRTLGRDILVVNRVSKSSVESPKGFYGYAGDQIANNVIRFDRGPNNKIFLKNISFSVYLSDSTK